MLITHLFLHIVPLEVTVSQSHSWFLQDSHMYTLKPREICLYHRASPLKETHLWFLGFGCLLKEYSELLLWFLLQRDSPQLAFSILISNENYLFVSWSISEVKSHCRCCLLASWVMWLNALFHNLFIHFIALLSDWQHGHRLFLNPQQAVLTSIQGYLIIMGSSLFLRWEFSSFNNLEYPTPPFFMG